MKADPLFDNQEPEIVGIHGPIGSGKTFAAATLSQFWPGNIIERTKSSGGKKIVLEDVLWGVIDSNATAGFTVMGVEPGCIYNFQKIRGSEAEWKKYGFNRRPSILETAMRFTILARERAQKGQTRIVIVDTASGLDGAFVIHSTDTAMNDPKLAGNKYARWDLNLSANTKFHDALKFSGVQVICYCMHSRPVDEESDAAKKKNLMVLVAGGAKFAPAITGQSAAVYKRDMTQEFFCKVTRVPGKKGNEAKKYSILTDVCEEGETKSRYGNIVPVEIDPNLRAFYKLVRAAQNKWK